MSKKFIFKFTEEHAGSMIRPHYQDPKERNIEIEANSFDAAIKKLKNILHNLRKNCFHHFSVFFDGSWHMLMLKVRNNVTASVFDITISETEFSIIN